MQDAKFLVAGGKAMATVSIFEGTTGVAYTSKNEFDKALADYDAAIRLDAKLSRPYFNRGLVLHQLPLLVG